MSNDCIFCKIVAKELPAAVVYEDDDTLSFMDIGPVERGHALVIPKLHCDPITSVPPELLQRVILTVQRVGQGMFDALAADGMNITQANGQVAGQIVPHVHFHVIPRFNLSPGERNWRPGKYDSPEDMEETAAKLRAAIEC